MVLRASPQMGCSSVMTGKARCISLHCLRDAFEGTIWLFICGRHPVKCGGTTRCLQGSNSRKQNHVQDLSRKCEGHGVRIPHAFVGLNSPSSCDKLGFDDTAASCYKNTLWKRLDQLYVQGRSENIILLVGVIHLFNSFIASVLNDDCCRRHQ